MPGGTGGASAGGNGQQGTPYLLIIGLILFAALTLAVALQGLDTQWPMP